MGNNILNEVDRVKVITLADNYIDLAAGNSTEMVKRAMPLINMELRNSMLAEHGFSALVRTTTREETRSLMFDFGFSKDAAARNTEAMKKLAPAYVIPTRCNGRKAVLTFEREMPDAFIANIVGTTLSF